MFTIVIPSLDQVNVAITLPLVVQRVEYETDAVGATVSTMFTVRSVLPVFPELSTYSYDTIYVPSEPVFTEPLV